jgi:hypothetical protein
MSVYCWIEYGYYDGLLAFSQVVLRPDPNSNCIYFRVRWLDSEAEYRRSA